MRYRYITLLILWILSLILTGCPITVHKKPENRIPFKSFIAEGRLNDNKSLVTLPIYEGFTSYDFTPLPHQDNSPDRKYVVKMVFQAENKSGKALFLPSLFYPVEVFLNGRKIYQSGFDRITNLYHSAYGSMIPLPPEILEAEKESIIAVRFFPHHYRHTFKRSFIGSVKDVYVYKFWYGFFHCTLITIFCAISFFYFLIFFFLWVSGRFRKKTYLFYSLLCFSLIFSYPNLIFSGLTMNEMTLTRISRISFHVAALFFLLFSIEYTKTLSPRIRRYTDSVIYMIMLAVFIIFMTAGSQVELKNWFNVLSKMIITPTLIIGPILFTISWYRTRRFGSLIIMLAIYLLAGTSLHDLIYFKQHLSPYVWLLPIGYLTLEVAISLILALEQGYLMLRIARQSTALKAANRQLVTAKKVAETANRAKTGVLSKIAHEFRTPLNGILGELQLINDSGENDGSDHVKNITNSSRRLLATINDVIDFSDLESGTFELRKSAFSFSERMNDLDGIIRGAIVGKNLTFHMNIDGSLPALIEGDAGRIQRVILSLIENSIKFTESGSISLDISMRQGEELDISVKDTGKGIPGEMQQEIFAAFEQGHADHSFTKSYEGLGLGLSITAKIIGMMDGTITVSSEPGKGSEFRIRIPVKRIEATAVQDDFSEIHALIVEDNVINAKILGSFLKKIGILSDVAANGREGLEKHASEHYDMIFMDVQMPVMNGLEATRAIREKERFTGGHIPIIAVTANARKTECIDAGMDAFMQKPVSVSGVATAVKEMMETMASALGGSNRRKEEAYYGETEPSEETVS